MCVCAVVLTWDGTQVVVPESATLLSHVSITGVDLSTGGIVGYACAYSFGQCVI